MQHATFYSRNVQLPPNFSTRVRGHNEGTDVRVHETSGRRTPLSNVGENLLVHTRRRKNFSSHHNKKNKQTKLCERLGERGKSRILLFRTLSLLRPINSKWVYGERKGRDVDIFPWKLINALQLNKYCSL